ncbi:MAG: TatD family hydrolase [Anaerolineaceae bacterium]|nr:TatD family hydrolase [Anaerolineaceae bacterium]
MLTDTHCHLYLDNFQNDIQEIIERAWQSGVERLLIPGLNIETSKQAIALSDQYENIFAAVGFHPNESQNWNEGSLSQLEELITHPKVVAIGEIGLDYYRKYSSHSIQQNVFQIQLELAANYDLPIIIHNRDAIQDLWPILLKWQTSLKKNGKMIAERPGIFHSFSGELSIAMEITSHHFLLGISGPVTYRKSTQLQSVAAKISLERMVLETDAPFLAPHPHRGHRNEPAHIRFTAQRIAELQNKSLKETANITSRNADQLFLWRA